MSDQCSRCKVLSSRLEKQKEKISKLREMEKESSDLLVLKAKRFVTNMPDGPARDLIIGLCNKLDGYTKKLRQPTSVTLGDKLSHRQ